MQWGLTKWLAHPLSVLDQFLHGILCWITHHRTTTTAAATTATAASTATTTRHHDEDNDSNNDNDNDNHENHDNHDNHNHQLDFSYVRAALWEYNCLSDCRRESCRMKVEVGAAVAVAAAPAIVGVAAAQQE